MKKILLASRNEHKLREIKEILNDYKVLSLDYIKNDIAEVIEDGKTFKDNAIKKAVEISEYTNILTIADDSGLCVDALDGKPGVYSARYAGDTKDDALNRKKVMAELIDIEDARRNAQFVCAIALAKQGKLIDVVEGVCYGYIMREEKGKNGFGYDSIFYCPSLRKTFAEATSEEKHQVSHRQMALKKIKNILLK